MVIFHIVAFFRAATDRLKNYLSCSCSFSPSICPVLYPVMILY